MLVPQILLAVLLTPGPACGQGPEEALRRLAQRELNLVRLGAGLRPLTTHPVFCRLARERVAAVLASGSTEVDLALLSTATRRVYRLGYRPHNWAQTALILNPGDTPLERWREVKPASFAESVLGDFEHLGVDVGRRDGRPVWAIYVALPKRTVEWREAGPLTDLAWVRREILLEVNRLREERDLAPLEPDERLDRAAQAHAEDLLAHAYYDHVGRDGSTARQRAATAGHRGAALITENIAKGPFTPREVVGRWMNSRGHRKNILHPRLRRMGAGVSFGENAKGFEVVWVQVFSGSPP